jgi:hypothetical protein
VLEGNWIGFATRPSRQLYPHQWSWDSACAALGWATVDQDRAAVELRSLFAAQWRNGLLPHIVFGKDGRYFPGPDYWQTERSPDAPAGRRTSGIVQPPLHATALLRLTETAPDRDRSLALVRDLLPRLAAWHGYLHRERTRPGSPLVEIWHPWESGMDNAPSWDAALARVHPAADEIPPYRRVDVEVVDASGRPSDAEYDRYAYLVRVLRDVAYAPAQARATTPFAVRSVLFNTLLVQADRDLAALAVLVGETGDASTARADALAAALDAELLVDADRGYADQDVLTGDLLVSSGVARFVPLFAGVPGNGRAEGLFAALEATTVEAGDGRVLPSVPVGDPAYDAARYWRGPVWPVLNWLFLHAARRSGRTDLAEAIRRGLLFLVRAQGFREHYDARRGTGQGGEDFSWTAALVLDLLAGPDDAARADKRSEGRGA